VTGVTGRPFLTSISGEDKKSDHLPNVRSKRKKEGIGALKVKLQFRVFKQ